MNAITKTDRVRANVWDGQYSRLQYVTLEDGSIVLSPEDLAVLGCGDSKEGAREIRRMIAIEKKRHVEEGKSERPASVRIADAKDEEAVFDLLMLDLKENAAMVATPDPEIVRGQIAAATRRAGPDGIPNGCIAGVIDGPNRKPVAVCILIPQQWWWSRAFHYQEQPLYVHVDHRRSNHFHDLVKFQKWWVDQMTAQYGHRVYLLCGVMGTKDVRRKTMAYRRWFRMAGAGFIYPAPFVPEGD